MIYDTHTNKALGMQIPCALLRAVRLRGGGTAASVLKADDVEASFTKQFPCLDANNDRSVSEDEIKQYLATDQPESATILQALGVSPDEAAKVLINKFGKDGRIGCAPSHPPLARSERLRRSRFTFRVCRSRDEAHCTFRALRTLLPPTKGLTPHDFSGLWHEKLSAHLAGTREWAFSEIKAWLDAAPAAEISQLFWLMGGGGTGKSVLTVALHDRHFDRVVAWHYCRHDDPNASAPSSLLRSLAAMLCHRLPGYKEALGEAMLAEMVTDPKELFEALFETPLKKVTAPECALFIILDALDELPKESQKSLLAVVAGQLSQLPPWLKLFVTSREEPQITTALAKFKPKELRVDEAKNRADVEVFLRTIARQHVKGQLSMGDVEAAANQDFKIDITGKLAELQPAMDSSRVRARPQPTHRRNTPFGVCMCMCMCAYVCVSARSHMWRLPVSQAIYESAAAALRLKPGYNALLQIPDTRPELTQASDEFDTVYRQAEEARQKLRGAIADEWSEDEERKTLGKTPFFYPNEAKKRPWVDQAIDPGVKGKERALQKRDNDYEGHANRLKDLARITLVCNCCERMVAIVDELRNAGFKVLLIKNKYQSPTPMGYCDLNLIVEIELVEGVPYLAEVQINHSGMLAAKKEAHQFYERVRVQLPEICKASGADPDKLEAFIVGRLNTSALDAAVEALSAKAEGLFLYAYLLAKHLESEAAAGRTVDFAGLDALPAGLGEVYTVNFTRSFPNGKEDPMWLEARPLVELIAAAREPITQEMAAALLAWDNMKQQRILEATALLFPVRDGKFHVFHKTIVDWLTGEITDGSSVKERSEIFQVERKDGHATLAKGFIAWLETRTDTSMAYWLQHGIAHLCRADGHDAKAAEVYATDLALLRQRIDVGLIGSVAKDFLELRTCKGLDLTAPTEMRQFVGKYMDVLKREEGAAVLQLASQQPDDSCLFKVVRQSMQGILKWCNKPQQKDACVATLSHKSCVQALAVSTTRIIGGSGNSLFVYDAETEELLEELVGTSEVNSVAICDSLIVAGFKDVTIKVWDAGEPFQLLP